MSNEGVLFTEESRVFTSVTTPNRGWGEIYMLSHPGLRIGFDGLMFIDPFDRAECIAKMEEANIFDHVVLPPRKELPQCAFQRLQELSEKAGICTSQLEVDDYSVPNEKRQQIWLDMSPKLIQKLREGHAVAFSCLSGVGRSPCMAARMLFELGVPGAIAIEKVRKVVEGAVETDAQLKWVSSDIKTR